MTTATPPSPSPGPSPFAALLAAIGRQPDEHLFISYIKPGSSMVNIPTTVAKAPEIAAQLAGHANVWFSVQPEDGTVRHANGRATKDTVTNLVTLYADLDYKGEGLTPIQAASVIRELSARLGSNPVAVVASGGGCQPYWAIEPIEPGLGQLVLDAWKLLVVGTARLHGGKADAGVYNLDRILRVPGPPNLKSEYGPGGAPTGVGFPDGRRIQMTTGDLLATIQKATEAIPPEHRAIVHVRTEHDARPETASGTGTPLDDFNTNATWDEILEPEGWTFHHADHNGTRYWTRPDKNPADGFSASTNKDGATGTEDRLYNWSSSVALETDTPMSKAYVYAQFQHRGDLGAATRAIAAKGYGQARPASNDWATPEKLAAVAAASRISNLPADATVEQIIAAAEDDLADLEHASIYNWEYPDGATHVQDDPDGWKATDLSGVLDGTVRQEPAEIGVRKDGSAMFYRGKINVLIGPSETGKSWIAVLACFQVMRSGGLAIYIDFEDDHVSVTNRLRALGASEKHLTENFVYIDPPGPLAGRPQMQANLEAYLDLRPDIIVVDAWNEAMTRFDMDWMEHKANNIFASCFLKQLAKSGAAVLALDHVPKDTQSTAKGAIGPQVKRAVVNGCSMRAWPTGSPLTPGKRGTIKLMVDKDRPGTVRQASTLVEREAYFGTFVLDGSTIGETNVMDCHIFPASLSAAPGQGPIGVSETDRKIMQLVMTELSKAKDGELTSGALERTPGAGNSAKFRQVVRHMEESGMIETARGARGSILVRRKGVAAMSLTEQQTLDAIMAKDGTD